MGLKKKLDDALSLPDRHKVVTICIFVIDTIQTLVGQTDRQQNW